MADEPISTTVPEVVTTDTGADAQTLGDLNKEFADFWGEQDAKPDGERGEGEAPAAPGEAGAAQETKPSKEPESQSKTETTESETPGAPAPKEITDEEIDKMGLKPHARPEEIADFKQIRDLWKADRAKLKATEASKTQLEQQLAEAKQNAWTPETKADYEHAAEIRRRFDFVSDPEFINKFQVPIIQQYNAILDEAVQALPDKQAAEAWAKHMKENYIPDQLNRAWWQEKVLAQIPNELDRQSLLSSVTQMLRLQKDRDTEIGQRTSDKSSFEKWINEKATTTQQRVSEEILSEIKEREKVIQDYLPRNEDDAKTDQERTAIKAHNERFNGLNEFFKDKLQDIAQHGPRAWVRVSIEATRAKILEENYKNLEKEHKAVLAERDKYKSELDKIAGARRKLSTTTGTPPASSTSKNGGLSIKDLDVRKSFEKFDWGENT